MARITVVNHAAVEINCAADVVWREILESYVEGRKFAASGYAFTPLTDDPAAFLGGYRMTMRNAEDAVIDDRICRITERDDAARRLSLCAEYLLPAEMQLVVCATYQAVPCAGGARYTLDCHSLCNVPLPASDSDPSVAQVAEQFRSSSAGHLDGFLKSVKERLEAAG